MKFSLVSAPVLILPNPAKPFTITTDTSDLVIGAILSQDQGKGDQPIAYESRKLSLTELNYSVHKKKLLAIVYAIKLWRTYLERQKFIIIIDYASLKYIKSQLTLSKR